MAINLQWVSNEITFIEDGELVDALNALIDEIERADKELGTMELWASQQEDNPFANQVRQWAYAERGKLQAIFNFRS